VCWFNLRSQELGVVLAGNLSGEVFRCKLELVSLGCVLLKLSGLLVQKLESVVLVHLLALGCRNAVLTPLPQLRTRYLSRRSIFHQVVDGHTANTAEPALHVAEANVEVLADAFLGDLARHVHVEKVVGGDLDLFAADVELVRSRHVLVEDFGSNDGECRVGDPGAIVASADFTKLVGAHRVHGLLVGFVVVLDGDLSSHATHSVHTTTMASLDEELDVGVHEGNSHGNSTAVGQNEVGVVAEALDHREDVVPATAVEARRVIAEFVDDLCKC
jgi:hypothetical protein